MCIVFFAYVLPGKVCVLFASDVCVTGSLAGLDGPGILSSPMFWLRGGTENIIFKGSYQWTGNCWQRMCSIDFPPFGEQRLFWARVMAIVSHKLLELIEKKRMPTCLFRVNLAYLVHSKQVEKQRHLKNFILLILESGASIGLDQLCKCMCLSWFFISAWQSVYSS